MAFAISMHLQYESPIFLCNDSLTKLHHTQVGSQQPLESFYFFVLSIFVGCYQVPSTVLGTGNTGVNPQPLILTESTFWGGGGKSEQRERERDIVDTIKKKKPRHGEAWRGRVPVSFSGNNRSGLTPKLVRLMLQGFLHGQVLSCPHSRYFPTKFCIPNQGCFFLKSTLEN